MGQHLTDGLTAWLGRELGGLAIEAPAHFDLPGVVSVVLQGLGVTYSHLRALLVARLDPGGEAAVEAMERAYGFLQELAAPGGLVAAWHQVLGLTGVHIQDLVGLVVGGATSWLEGRLTVSVTEHLLTLCSGAGSIVAIIQSIYNAVTFFINNRDAIAALADRVLGMVSTIARGKAADLAHLGGEVEATMASTLPLLIDFLARQFGLGDIGGEISRLINQVQQPITTLENKLVGVIARKAHVYGHAAPGAPRQGGRVRPGDFPRKEVETDEGRHTIYVEMQGDRAVVMMASTPAPLIAFFDAAARDDTIPAQDKEHIPEGLRLVAHLNALVQQIVADALVGKAETETQPLKTAMAATEDRIAEIITEVLRTSKDDVAQFDHRYKLEGLVTTYENMPEQTFDDFTPDHQPQSAALKEVARLPQFANLFIQVVALPTKPKIQAPGGYCINLHQHRHEAGRTYGPKSQGANGTLALFQAKLTTKLQAAGSNVDDQRTAALAALKEELAADVRTMREAIQAEDRETYNEVWQDILGLRLSNMKKRDWIQMIRHQILAGENRVAWQDFDRLARPL